MSDKNRDEERMIADQGPDPSWRGLYKAGGISAFSIPSMKVSLQQVF